MEYLIVAAIIAASVFAAFTIFGNKLGDLASTIMGNLNIKAAETTKR